MSKNEANAAPAADLLARAYIDAFAAAENVKIRSMLRGSAQTDSLETILADLEDDEDENGPHLREDLVVAAVLTTKAVAGEPGLAKRLRKEGPIVTLETHTADMVPLVLTIIEDCTAANNKQRHVVARDGSEKSHSPDRGNREVIAALNRRVLTVGISSEARRYVPNTLQRTAEYRLVLPPIDEWALKLVLEAITGEVLEVPVDPYLIRTADTDDLSLAFRRGLSPAPCIERLAKILTEKQNSGRMVPCSGTSTATAKPCPRHSIWLKT